MSESHYFKKLLHSLGLKATPNRLAVLDVLSKKRTHPSVEQILEYLKEDKCNVSLASLYHILGVFEQKRIIQKVSTDKEVVRYDVYMGTHYHLVSENSSEIKDYEDEELTALLDEYFKKNTTKGFKIAKINLQLTGEFVQEEQ